MKDSREELNTLEETACCPSTKKPPRKAASQTPKKLSYFFKKFIKVAD